MGSIDFLDTILDDPEEVERREIHNALAMVQPFNGYDFDEEPPGGDANEAQERVAVLEQLMERVCALEPLDLGLARHVLRRCRRYGIRAIVPALFEHVEHFAPVMNDVVLYLNEVMSPRFMERNLASLESLISNPSLVGMRWTRYWLSELIVRNPPLLEHTAFLRFIMEQSDLEHQAQAALLRNSVAWVREHRTRIDQLGGWPRLQVLRSGLALATDERRHWYRNVQANNRAGIERWFLRWLINQQ